MNKETQLPSLPEQSIEKKESISQQIKVVNLVGKYETKQAISFDDCVYEDTNIYQKKEIYPFLLGNTELKHSIGINDLLLLMDMPEYNNMGYFAALIVTAERIGIEQDDMEKLYSIVENKAKLELLYNLILKKVTAFKIQKNIEEIGNIYEGGNVVNSFDASDKLKKRFLEIEQKYRPNDTMGNKDDFKDEGIIPATLRKEVVENPQKSVLFVINNLPIMNAIKAIKALSYFIEKHKDQLQSDEIIAAINNLDEDKYVDKPEMISTISKIFK